MSFIERLQLTAEEKQIYQLLLGCGQLTSFETAQFSKLHMSNVNIALDSLVTKGAIGMTEGYINKYYVKIPLEYLAESSDKLNSDIQSNLTEATNFIQNKQNSFNELRENLTTQLNESAAQKKVAIDNTLNNVSSSLKSTNHEQRQSLTTKTAELSTKMNALGDTKKTEISTAVKGYLDETVSNLSQAKTTLNTIVGNMKQQAEGSLSTSNEQMSSTTQESLNSIQVISETLQPNLEEFNRTYMAEINGITQLIKQNIDTSKLDTRSFNSTQSEKYLGYASEITKNAEKNIDTISEAITSNLQGLGESLDLLLNRKVEELSLNVQEAVNSLNEKISNIKSNLITELQQQKNTTISSTVSQIKETMALKYTDLQNNEQSQKNNLISERDMFMQKLEGHHQETLQQYNEKISEVQTGAITRFNSLNEDIGTKFDEISRNIENNLHSNVESFRNLSSQLNSTFADVYVAGSDQLKEKWSDLIAKAEILIQESEAAINQHYQEVSNLVQSTTVSFNEGLNNYMQQSLDSTINAANQLAMTSKANIDEGKQLIAGSLNTEITDSVNFLEDNNRKVTDIANYLISTTMKLKNDFRSLEATSKETTIPPVQTTSIIGLEAVKDHIARIVKDTKRSVTILSPEPDYIPLESIKLLPSTAKVTIVTKLDEQIDSDWIALASASASASQANVEIRKFREAGAGGDMPRFITVERTNEEVLIAAQDEATGEVVGILSKSTYFAKLFSYLIIADALGRSSQLK